jgi:hypothetical protein
MVGHFVTLFKWYDILGSQSAKSEKTNRSKKDYLKSGKHVTYTFPWPATKWYVTENSAGYMNPIRFGSSGISHMVVANKCNQSAAATILVDLFAFMYI